ncbi:MAG: UvrD-helicase domain-containing protein [Lachnospiraceae bacterium]|nr:UvrD-helicase domain-containing protein [Lachnospiraceae bacterium]
MGRNKGLSKKLKTNIIELVSGDSVKSALTISYSGDSPITETDFDVVQYQNYRDLQNGIISHDDVLKIANYMYESYPLLSKILCDKYDYIFIDEYQDTQASVIEIFLQHIKETAKQSLCIGFFGDRMQSIYDTGIGNLQMYIDLKDVTEIKKADNYRCSVKVIDLLNRLRSDIKQEPAMKREDGTIVNKAGSAIFLYSDSDFNLEDFQTSKYSQGWDLENFQETKVLFLTHRLSAVRLGFAELLAAFSSSERIIGNKPDFLAKHLLKMGNILYHYSNKCFSVVLELLQKKIMTNADKQSISKALSDIESSIETGTIGDIIDCFDKEKFLKKDDSFEAYVEKYGEIYNKVKILPATQLMSYFSYYNNYSPYSTQHGIKGAEFENVLVVMDNGRWNNYNFKYYFEQTPGKESVIRRTERIFYVCCSRAKNNLIVYYPNPTTSVIEKAKELFGEENVKKM